MFKPLKYIFQAATKPCKLMIGSWLTLFMKDGSLPIEVKVSLPEILHNPAHAYFAKHLFPHKRIPSFPSTNHVELFAGC